jgi:hypothetical protein
MAGLTADANAPVTLLAEVESYARAEALASGTSFPRFLECAWHLVAGAADSGHCRQCQGLAGQDLRSATELILTGQTTGT